MILENDAADFVELLNQHGVDFMAVGSYALDIMSEMDGVEYKDAAKDK